MFELKAIFLQRRSWAVFGTIVHVLSLYDLFTGWAESGEVICLNVEEKWQAVKWGDRKERNSIGGDSTGERVAEMTTKVRLKGCSIMLWKMNKDITENKKENS